jgi:cytochrome c oxidase subunit 3
MTLTQQRTRKPATEPQMMENQRLILWCFMIVSILGFGAFTSAYIVRIAQGNWFKFELPDVFTYNCLTVIASSITMFMAYKAAKEDEIERVKYFLLGTILLGFVFLYLQFAGFKELTHRGIFFSPARTDNGDLSPMVSGSFFYVISWTHLVHILAGLIFLGIVTIRAFRLRVHKKNMLSISLASTFWHFVGFLWIALFAFLKFWN